jgi:hypothetical protein
VKAVRRTKPRTVVAACNRDFRGKWNRVDEAVPNKGALETERSSGRAFGDLDEIEVGERSIGPPIEAAAESDQFAGIPEGINTTARQARSAPLFEREDLSDVG